VWDGYNPAGPPGGILLYRLEVKYDFFDEGESPPYPELTAASGVMRVVFHTGAAFHSYGMCVCVRGVLHDMQLLSLCQVCVVQARKKKNSLPNSHHSLYYDDLHLSCDFFCFFQASTRGTGRPVPVLLVAVLTLRRYGACYTTGSPTDSPLFLQPAFGSSVLVRVET